VIYLDKKEAAPQEVPRMANRVSKPLFVLKPAHQSATQKQPLIISIDDDADAITVHPNQQVPTGCSLKASKSNVVEVTTSRPADDLKKLNRLLNQP